MKLSEENIQTLYKTLIEIFEDRYNVKITYKIVKKEELKETNKNKKSPTTAIVRE